MSEEIYDREIAPELLKLATRCKELGMSFIAQVEYAPGETSRTDLELPDASSKQKLVHWAARCNGNVDSLFLTVDRHAAKVGHSSIYLQMAGNKNVKFTGNETAAISITSEPKKGSSQ